MRERLSIFLVLVLATQPSRAQPDRASTPRACLTAAIAASGREIPESELSLELLPFFRRPIVVAHGKNDNIATESTWENMAHSLENGAQVLEIDIQFTRDGHGVIAHDPTPHRIAPGFTTPQQMLDALRQHNPQFFDSLRPEERGLIARFGNFTLAQIQEQIRLRDHLRNRDVPIITLQQLLEATGTAGSFNIPSHTTQTPGGEPQTVPARRLALGRNPILYLDLKDINQLARRLYDLPTWDWDRNRLPTTELIAFTRRALTDLRTALLGANAFNRTFIAVRHPMIARLAREVDPRIQVMFSPDNVTREMSIPDLVRAIDAFGPNPTGLVEVKFLNHILNPEFRRIARERGWRLFYNQIEQADRTQFQGVYQNNLPRLIQDILALGNDVIIQTNTVPQLRQIVDGRP